MPEIRYIIPRHNDDNFKRYIEPSMHKIGGQAFQVMDDPNKKESIHIKYQTAVDAIRNSNDPNVNMNDDDIIVFTHEDIGIADNLFKPKLEMIFAERPDIGLVGIAGTTEFTELGGWWMNAPDKLRGHLIQGKPDGKEGEGFYLKKGPIGFFDDVVAIDGCIMATTAKIVKEVINFDLENFKDANDFYDIDLGFQLLEKGYKLAVADILVFHKSMGMGAIGSSWQKYKDVLINKWKNKGFTFPITVNNFGNRTVVTPKQPSKIVEIEI